MADACIEEQQRASDYLQASTCAKLLQVVEQQLQGESSACSVEASPAEASLAGVASQAHYQTLGSMLSLAHESQIELYSVSGVQESIASFVRIGREDLLIPDVESSVLYVMWVCSSGNSADIVVAANCLAELVHIAPTQLLAVLGQHASNGQPFEKVVALACFERCINRKGFSSESLDVPKLIVMTATALSTSHDTADSIWPQKLRLAAIKLAKALLCWPHVNCHLISMLIVTDSKLVNVVLPLCR